MTESAKNKVENKPEEQTFVLQINAQYIKDLSFEAPALPQAFLALKKPPEISIDIDVAAKKADEKHHYTVDLSIKVRATMDEDHKTLFLCELVYGGLVTLEAPENHIEPLLLIEIPHLLFPYARSIIGTLVREAGFPALQINPIDFASLYRAKLAHAQQEKQQKKGE